MPPNPGDTQFGAFRLSPRERRLLQNGQDVPLTPKAFDTLVVLVTHAGQLVEKQDLMKAVWGDVFVDDSTLTQNIFTLRNALGNREFIETVPRRGYRFTAPVTPLEVPRDPDPIPAPLKTGFRVGRRHVLGALGLGAVWVYVGRLPYNPLEGAEWTEITKSEADDLDAVISPDGKFVAYLTESNGFYDIMMYDVAARDTRHWSSDGWGRTVPFLVRDLGFTASGWVWNRPPNADRTTAGQLQKRSLSGGGARPLLEDDASLPVWSPDGKLLAYIRTKQQDAIYVTDGDATGKREKIFGGGEEGMHNHPIDWSPDGAWIYFTRGRLGTPNQLELWRIRPNGKDQEQLTDFLTDIGYPCVLDDRTILYVARDEKDAGPWLWALDLKTGKPLRIPSGTDQFIGLAASREGRRVVATRAKPTAKLWSVKIPPSGRVAGDIDMEEWPVGAERALSPRFEDSHGKSLLFLSSNGGGDGLWRYREGDKKPEERWNGKNGALFGPPPVSRDGKIAIKVRTNGRPAWNLLDDQESLQPLGQGLDIFGNATWNPDGTKLLAGGQDKDGWRGLFLIPADGSAPSRFLKDDAGDAQNPIWSAEADLIVYSSPAGMGRANLRAVRSNGDRVDLPSEAQVSTTSLQSGVFLRGGESLIYRLAQNFFRLDIATKTKVPIIKFSLATTIESFDVTPDGERIVFDKVRRNSDVHYIDLPAKPWWRNFRAVSGFM